VASPSRHNERGCADRGRGAKVGADAFECADRGRGAKVGGLEAKESVERNCADRGRSNQRACWAVVNDGPDREPRIKVKAASSYW
jgi:hypothetical protein